MSDRRESTGPRPAKGAPPRARSDGPAEAPDRVKELAGPLGRVLKRLPKVERDVVEMRMGMTDGHPRNLADTARALNLSSHEAKEIEQRAFERIREVVPLRELERYLQS